jgi:hypothetical protein
MVMRQPPAVDIRAAHATLVAIARHLAACAHHPNGTIRPAHASDDSSRLVDVPVAKAVLQSRLQASRGSDAAAGRTG